MTALLLDERRTNTGMRTDVSAIIEMAHERLISRAGAARLMESRRVPIHVALRLLTKDKRMGTETRDQSYFRLRDTGKLSSQQQWVVARMLASNAKYGEHDFTRQEIAALTRYPINVVTGRVNELIKCGVLVETGKRPCKVTRNTVSVVRIAEQQCRSAA